MYPEPRIVVGLSVGMERTVAIMLIRQIVTLNNSQYREN